MRLTIITAAGRALGYAALLLCICIVAAMTATAQWKFQSWYGCTNFDDEARGGVQPVSAALGGGYIAAGKSFCRAPNTKSDIYVVRTTANGAVTWQQFYDLGGNDSAMDIEEVKHDPTRRGGFIITGITENSNNCCTREDIFLLRIDEIGNV